MVAQKPLDALSHISALVNAGLVGGTYTPILINQIPMYYYLETAGSLGPVGPPRASVKV